MKWIEITFRFGRHFFAMKSNSGCSRDIGWSQVLDIEEYCSYGTGVPQPAFFYTTTGDYQSSYDMGHGDVFMVTAHICSQGWMLTFFQVIRGLRSKHF